MIQKYNIDEMSKKQIMKIRKYKDNLKIEDVTKSIPVAVSLVSWINAIVDYIDLHEAIMTLKD